MGLSREIAMKYPFLILFVAVLMTTFVLMMLARFALYELEILALGRRESNTGQKLGEIVPVLNGRRR
jgi:hypothetical protein